MKRVLLVSSNGTGLGHLTRSMAIARRLPEGVEPILLTMSHAAGVAREQGFLCEHHPSPQTVKSGGRWVRGVRLRLWDRLLARRLDEMIEEHSPAALVFDGVNPYGAVLRTVRDRPLVSVWCRRAMWRPGVGAAKLASARYFDAVLEPGEFAADADRGATVGAPGGGTHPEVIEVGPIVFLDDEELLPRERAAAELGLDPARPAALVHLGAGGPEIEAIAGRCVERLGHESGLQVAVLESAIHAGGELPANAHVLRATYPISRFYAAFDFAVSAAGYNAYHEMVQLGPPALWVPMAREMDDQAARARFAEEAGIGRCCEDTTTGALEGALDDLLDPARREAMRARLAELHPSNGAAEAAQAIAGLLADG
jgi:UDP:flavonoid glycosyltransferase YjiC (YdhE family)